MGRIRIIVPIRDIPTVEMRSTEVPFMKSLSGAQKFFTTLFNMIKLADPGTAKLFWEATLRNTQPMNPLNNDTFIIIRFNGKKGIFL